MKPISGMTSGGVISIVASRNNVILTCTNAKCSDFDELEEKPVCDVGEIAVTHVHNSGDIAPNGTVVLDTDPWTGEYLDLTCYSCSADVCAAFNQSSQPVGCEGDKVSANIFYPVGTETPTGEILTAPVTCYFCTTIPSATCLDFGELTSASCESGQSVVTTNHPVGAVAPNGAIVRDSALTCYSCFGVNPSTCASFGKYDSPPQCESGQINASIFYPNGTEAPDGSKINTPTTCYYCIPDPSVCANFGKSDQPVACEGGKISVPVFYPVGTEAPNGVVIYSPITCYYCIEDISVCANFGQSDQPVACESGKVTATAFYPTGTEAPNGVKIYQPTTCYYCIDCAYGDWVPPASDICLGRQFQQSRSLAAGFQECPPITQQAIGTKVPTWSEWSPDPSTVCLGEWFQQTKTNDCGGKQTRSVQGTAPITSWTEWYGPNPNDYCSFDLVQQIRYNNCGGDQIQDVPGTISCSATDCISKSASQQGTGTNPNGPCVDFTSATTGPSKASALYSCTGHVDDSGEITWSGGSYSSPATGPGPCFGAHNFSFTAFINKGGTVTCNASSWGGTVGCSITCCIIVAP